MSNFSHSPQLAQYFPSYSEFASVCRNGLSQVRPLRESARTVDDAGWNFGSAAPPSYYAYGRLRALFTLNVAASLRGSRVLEIAAGDGSLSATLQQMGAEVTVNDLRAEELSHAMRHFTNGGNVRIASGNLFEIDPVETGKFDLVIACEVIEHVADPAALLIKLKSFLRPAGRILLTTPNGAYFRNKLPTFDEVQDHEALVRRQFKPDADGHLYLLTPEEMGRLGGHAGLSVESYFIWGTPAISGEAGARALAPVLHRRICYECERACYQLPYFLRRRLGNSLMYVFR